MTDTQPFIDNTRWIARFGKPLIVREPDRTMPDAASAKPDKKYLFLMFFEDGNRIDLTFRQVNTAAARRQTVVLLYWKRTVSCRNCRYRRTPIITSSAPPPKPAGRVTTVSGGTPPVSPGDFGGEKSSMRWII